MAASSIPNLFSFFTPSKPPSAPPSHLSLPSSAATTATTRDRWSPLVSSSKEIQPNTLSLSSSCPSDVMSVVCPSLACANTFFFKSSVYNVEIEAEEDESEESIINRFRREVAREGILQEARRRMFHENAQDKKKRKRQEANRRIFRRRQQSNFFNEDREEMPKKNDKDDSDDDNWDIPSEGEIPYWGNP